MKIAAALLFFLLSVTIVEAQQRWRCVVSAGGVQVHTSTYSSADACRPACASVAYTHILLGKVSISWACNPA